MKILFAFACIILIFSFSHTAQAGCPTATMGIKPTGYVFHNADYDVLEACQSDGTWVALSAIKCPDGNGCAPDPFSFTDQTSVATSTLIQSNTITITGITGAVAVSVSGDGNPKININGGGWVTSGTITDGQSLQVELTSNASNSTTNSATVTVGSGSDQWDVTTGAGAPTGCPSIGDTCSDGTIYAGLSPDGNVAMYTTASDQISGAAYWGTYSYSAGDTSAATGKANSADVYAHVQAGDGTYNPDDGKTPNAFVLCEELTANGHSDWYLPAKDELNVLYTNKTAIGGFNISGSNPAGYYWSSTENGNKFAWYQRFSGGFQDFSYKYYGLSVRCVRK